MEHTAHRPRRAFYRFHSGAPRRRGLRARRDGAASTAANALLRRRWAAGRSSWSDVPRAGAGRPAGATAHGAGLRACAAWRMPSSDQRIVALDARPGARHRPHAVRGAVSRPVHRVRHRRAGHGLAGGRPGARRACCRSCHSFACFLSTRAERADLQQRDRADEGRLRRLARRAAAGRARALAPVGARHRRAGAARRDWS